MDTSLRVKRRHRSWPDPLKREIVAASFAPGASVSIVARQYNVNSNQVFAWRKLYGDASVAAPGPQLVPVMVTPDQRVEDAPANSPPYIQYMTGRLCTLWLAPMGTNTFKYRQSSVVLGRLKPS